jgi:tRNA threonylcarbamoyl adenosine modification protein (Sua5/YciO/YrdC/YwlC family)
LSEPVPTIEAADAPPTSDSILRVRRALEEGGIAALPTETVYGLAARADDAGALARLARLKARPQERAFTWHVGHASAIEGFETLVPLLKRLAASYWPGPLTLVARGAPKRVELLARDGWVGIRCPAHRGTAGLLEALPFPVAMTSANRHGEKPLLSAAEVREAFGPAIALVVDAGRPRLGEESGVLRVGPGRFELLREGLSSLDALRRAAGLAIGFVCTGNTCRSPMAAAIARRTLEGRLGVGRAADASARRIEDFGFRTISMGLFARAGERAADHAIELFARRGLDLSAHLAQSATLERLRDLDLVFGLTQSHVDALRAELPPGRTPRLELLDPTGRDIPDPIGGPREDYERCATLITQAIEARAPSWA